ncbi:hypothetical protein VTN77DRAFT_8110 [Rasamsonia byssochlamydoides]|uniref:uncharacterized protein n=1 Tax=Rasamsonia byssochlamydoides TaxID=89139 RepID=UPI0037439D53
MLLRVRDAWLQRSVNLSPELLEKLYLASKSDHVRHSPSQFANPSALGFMGFAIADVTFAMVLMGWGGAASLTSVVGIFFFTGPLLLILTTIFEWVMGRFLSMMICGFFSVFWFSFGLLQLPTMGIAASYSATGDAAQGAVSVGYNAGIALYLVAMGCALFTFFVFTLRTNVVLALIIGLATVAVYVLSAAYFSVSRRDFHRATQLQHAGGALLFVVGLLGWYMTVVIMAGESGFPNLPCGDLSHLWPQPSVDAERSGKQA